MSKPGVVGYASSEGLDAVRSESQAVFIYPTPVGFGEHASQALIRLTDHEAAMAEVQEDRDQQYDMKVKAREQRDAMAAERNELLGLLREAVLIIDERIVLGENDDSFIYAINSALERHKC